MRLVLLLVMLVGCTGHPDWTVVGSERPEALLSITGTATDDVWAVGADAGAGPAVLHWDGAAWSTLDTGTAGDLWWVFVEGDGQVWMVGADGRVLSHDRATGEVVEEVLAPGVTLFGIWGAGDGVLWAVGGDLGATDGGAALWRREGGAWSEVALPSPADQAPALYKVWGAAADDAWICGADGLLLHWDGTAWSVADSPTDRTLFTVHGTGAGAAWAVGGYGSAALAAWDGTAWADHSPPFAPQLNGVFARGDDVVAVGRQGAVWWRAEGGWEADPREPATGLDYHAGWLDPTGALWAVGGALSSRPLERGVLVYGGHEPPSPIVTATRRRR